MERPAAHRRGSTGPGSVHGSRSRTWNTGGTRTPRLNLAPNLDEGERAAIAGRGRRGWHARPYPDPDAGIPLVEDEPEAARLLAKGLREQSYAVDVAGDGAAAVFRAETTNDDAIILDIMPPALDGLGVCRALRQAGSSVPILIVTARGTVHARVEGLDSGADDHLTAVRFHRAAGPPAGADRRGAGCAAGPPARRRPTLDTRSREVTNAGEKVALTTRRIALLEYFARTSQRGDSGRAEIAEHVWDESYDAFSNVIDVYVQRLRRKLDLDDGASVIATRRGQGYIFMPGEC